MTEYEKILGAMKDMKKELITHFDSSVQAVKDITQIKIDHIEDDIKSLKKQSEDHYKKDEKILGQVAEIVIDHTQQDARHVEEVDAKIDRHGERMSNIEHHVSDKIEAVEKTIISIKEQANGRKSNGATIITMSGFAFMILGGLSGLYVFFTGGKP